MVKIYSKNLLTNSFAKVYDKDAMAKYDSLRKIDRNEMLRQFYKSHPELSYKEVGETFNIDQSRAWRIINGNKKAHEENEESGNLQS